jgi:RNA polymerase sigma-70 factor (ECF subfamily)
MGLSSQAADTDAALARSVSAAGGDTAAEAELCRRFARRALLYGLKHLRDPADAEDLAQEALVTVLVALREGKLREPEQLASFVLGTCRTLALAQRRKTTRQRELLERELGHERQTVHEAAARLPREVDGARLQACLERLSERDQTLVVLSFQQERSADDIGAALGLSAGNVRVLRHRTLARLHGCIEEVGAAP